MRRKSRKLGSVWNKCSGKKVKARKGMAKSFSLEMNLKNASWFFRTLTVYKGEGAVSIISNCPSRNSRMGT